MFTRQYQLIALFVAAVCFGASPVVAEKLIVVGFNVEGEQPSGSGFDSEVNGVIESVKQVPECDIWGFTEVPRKRWAYKLRDAAGSNYKLVLGTTGGIDRMAIVYNDERLKMIGKKQQLDTGAGGRDPLMATFRMKSTGTGFRFMVNHFHRRNTNGRRKQARYLSEWIRARENRDPPLIAVGDYNFDWDIEEEEGNRSFRLMTRYKRFVWVQPEELRPTQCSDPGKRQYNSILDFVFVTGDACYWSATSEILEFDFTPCPDDKKHSDHRLVRAEIELPQ